MDCLRKCLRLLLGLALLASAQSFAAEERRDTRPVLDPPPPALPQTVTVARGARLDIQLRIYGVQNEPLRYLIKTPPRHGRLGEPRSVAREVSAVSYEPPSDLTVTADRFTYAVQSHAGVSAPVEVLIAITDLPPRLSVAASLDFGELLAGDTAVREIEVANRGGGRIEGQVEVDPPLRVEGRANYRLEAGDYTYFKVTFAPSEGGTFHREIRYTSDREFITSVTGSAQTPISAEPARVELHHGPESAVRTGAFEIVNRTGDERTFKLNGGSRLQLPESITVPSHGRVAIAVSTRAEDVAEIDDADVRVESSGFALVVPARADTVGPILRLPQPSVGLGRVDAARGMQSTVELENVGGTAAQVTAEIGAPFALPEPTFSVAPGERKRVRLSVEPAQPQRYRTWLKFKAGPTNAELEVSAELVSGMSSAANRTSRSDEFIQPKAAPNPEDVAPWTPDLNLGKSIRVARIGTTSADLEWPVEFNGAHTFRVQRMMLTRDSAHELSNTWVDLPKATFARRDPLWIASLTGMTPNQSQTVRVVPLDGEGKPGDPLFRFDFYTLPRASFPKPRLLPTLFVVLLAIGGFMLFRKTRRHFTEPLSGF